MFFVCAVQDFLSSAARDGPSLNRALCASSRAHLSFQVGASNWPVGASCMPVCVCVRAVVVVVQAVKALTCCSCMHVWPVLL